MLAEGVPIPARDRVELRAVARQQQVELPQQRAAHLQRVELSPRAARQLLAERPLPADRLRQAV
jgi:hypothetical protein